MTGNELKEIREIVKSVEEIQNSNESDYTKMWAKISAYNTISDLVGVDESVDESGGTGMTNEEAKQVLSCSSIQQFCFFWVCIGEKVLSAKEALDMAIKALEELPKRRKEAKRWKRRAAQSNRSTFECGYNIGYRDGKYNEYQPDAYQDIERLTRKEQA